MHPRLPLMLSSPISSTTSRLVRSTAQRVYRQSLTTTIANPAAAYRFRTFHSTSRKMTVHNVDSVDTWKETLEKNKIVLLDCFATWCGPCKAIAPLLAKLSNEDEFQGVFFAKIDVDELPDLAQDLSIRAMPTFKIFIDGKEADELVGANPHQLKELITKGVTTANASS